MITGNDAYRIASGIVTTSRRRRNGIAAEAADDHLVAQAGVDGVIATQIETDAACLQEVIGRTVAGCGATNLALIAKDHVGTDGRSLYPG